MSWDQKTQSAVVTQIPLHTEEKKKNGKKTAHDIHILISSLISGGADLSEHVDVMYLFCPATVVWSLYRFVQMCEEIL